MSNAAPQRQCSHVSSCELFPKFGLRGALKVWHTFYCQGRYERCARYQRSMRGEPVSPNLLPNGKELNVDLLVRASV